MRIRTPTGPNNGSAEKRGGKRRGGSSECKFTFCVFPQREVPQECTDRGFSPDGKWKSESNAGEDGHRCAVGGSTCRKQRYDSGFYSPVVICDKTSRSEACQELCKKK